MMCECPFCGELIEPEIVDGGYVCPICGKYFTEFDITEWVVEDDL